MFILEFFQGIYTLFTTEPSIALARLLLVAVGLLFVYLSYKKVLEPLIMLPMGVGMIAVNGGLMVMEAGQVGNLFVNPMASNVDQLMYYLQHQKPVLCMYKKLLLLIRCLCNLH